MKKIVCSVFGCFFLSFSFAQQAIPEKPKLIVGIVVDQMRYDLLWRYWDLYSTGGFKKLVNEGFLCEDAQYNYFLTVTAAGHASIYTGTTPAVHGIVDNFWYDRSSKSYVYAVTDSSVTIVGSSAPSVSSSPYRLLTSTITDELKLASPQSKVFGIAEKDRSAIMPAGHQPDGAFWFDVKTGNWITSTWYMKQLPLWLQQFNQKHSVDAYLKNDWTLLLSRNMYTASTSDTVPYEHPINNELLPVFPHHLGEANYTGITYSPFGNSLTKDLAEELIDKEQLGQDDATDFLSISFSSTDLVQHMFGPNSLETEDCYLRLDKDLKELFAYIDEKVGMNNVLIFLTADHGGAISPLFANAHNLSGGVVHSENWKDSLNHFLSKTFGAGEWVSYIADQEIWLNRDLIAASNKNEEAIGEKIRDFLLAQPGVLCVMSPMIHSISNCYPNTETIMMNGYQPNRSGDILFSLAPGWIDWYYPQGTSHGTVYSYDNHVPLLWFGWKIAHGSSSQKVVIPDIAPTISNWLHLSFPSGCTGNPISFIPLK